MTRGKLSKLQDSILDLRTDYTINVALRTVKRRRRAAWLCPTEGFGSDTVRQDE
jgi:hypothetical protein